MNSSTLQIALRQYKQRSIVQLEHWMDSLGHKDQPLIQAMKHGSLLGGKRIRPYLTYVTGQLLGLSDEALDTPAAAVECMHAYALIHDDLPAMDDDNLRRGQPTCHVAFDEANAVLAGDALQTLAFTILAEGELCDQGNAYRIHMIRELAFASGAAGMCLGQALDLAAKGKHIDLQALETIHRHKTGALIRCAVRLGAYAAGGKGVRCLQQFDKFSEAIGLAFQVQDDIIDITSDTKTLGKPQGSDIEANKSTYPALFGIEGAKEKAELLYKESIHALDAIPYNTQQLELFAKYIIERNN
ncbi:(2E,6E)-farnesyl diphosphate synthase [Candidatus Enterovibrio altilux]|uniref:Octaprenyl-diphosphate synthase n=1 Tax=Candidatus Enterovibrio altilux TaxID=1927128 RepID=A0A291B6K3_9GAMM|nr:(2E,6E)-farnesyl diphosphate synthase [Candidatus Enterovibrio luxaltus]ATF08625.1 Octaprenyl-diphosphate synthase [Candidatus Enterovibrio luxaltus]